MTNDTKRDQIFAPKTTGVTDMEVVKHLKMCQKSAFYASKCF